MLLYSVCIRHRKLLGTQTLINCIEVFVGIFVIVAIALIIRVNYRHLPVTENQGRARDFKSPIPDYMATKPFRKSDIPAEGGLTFSACLD